MPAAKLSNDQVIVIRELRKCGAGIEYLAAEFGVSKWTIYGVASARYRNFTTNRKISFELAQELRRRRAEGERLVDLVAEYGMSKSTMQGILMNRRYYDPNFTPVRIDRFGNARIPPVSKL